MKNKYIFAYLLFGLTITVQASDKTQQAFEDFVKNMHQGTCPVRQERLADHTNLLCNTSKKALQNNAIPLNRIEEENLSHYNKNHAHAGTKEMIHTFFTEKRLLAYIDNLDQTK